MGEGGGEAELPTELSDGDALLFGDGGELLHGLGEDGLLGADPGAGQLPAPGLGGGIGGVRSWDQVYTLLGPGLQFRLAFC